MAKTIAGRPFAVFDIDGTLIRWQLYHAVVNQLAKQGIIGKTTNDKIQAARMTWKNRGSDKSFAEYEWVLVQNYWKALVEISPADHDKAVEAVFNKYKDQVYTYTRDLIRDLKAKEYLLFAISGSHQEIIDKLAAHHGFDAAIGQVHKIENGRFSGAHTTPMLNKDRELKKLIKKFGATYDGSIAIGDSASDILMLELVEQPIAFNPNRLLFQHAKKQDWKIVVERKNMVYELEARGGEYVLV